MLTADFSNIHMTEREVFALRRMGFHMSVRCNDTVKLLIAHGYADYTKYKVENRARFPDSNRARITEKGIAYLKYREQKFIKDYFFDIINFAVALAALILSILK